MTLPEPQAPPPRQSPTAEQMLRPLRRSNEVAQRAMALDKHPFGSVPAIVAETVAMQRAFWLRR